MNTELDARSSEVANLLQHSENLYAYLSKQNLPNSAKLSFSGKNIRYIHCIPGSCETFVTVFYLFNFKNIDRKRLSIIVLLLIWTKLGLSHNSLCLTDTNTYSTTRLKYKRTKLQT